MSSTEDQLISFFAYSFFIHPITSYLVSPQRKYPRWQGALYAVIFLISVSLLHIYYDQSDSGLNHYQLLQVPRGSSTSVLKKAYRHLSLELHPDKNKSPDAIEEFRKVKQAFDVLNNGDVRRVYDILGNSGAKIAAQSVVDQKYIIIQMMVSYASSIVFTFLMTFSESSGDAMTTSLFGLFECLLVLEKCKLSTTIFPFTTPFEIVKFCHRMYPGYINICRCLTGVYQIDYRGIRTAALKDVTSTVLQSSELLKDLTYNWIVGVKNTLPLDDNTANTTSASHGIAHLALQRAKQRAAGMSARPQLQDSSHLPPPGQSESKGMMAYFSKLQKHKTWGMVFNLGVYLLVIAAMSKYKNRSDTKA